MCTVSTAKALAVRTTAPMLASLPKFSIAMCSAMPAAIDVGDDRLPRPVPVGVDDVAGVARRATVLGRSAGRRAARPAQGPTPGAPVLHSVGPASATGHPDRGMGSDHRDRCRHQGIVDIASIDLDAREITIPAKSSNRDVPAHQCQRLPDAGLSGSVTGFAGRPGARSGGDHTDNAQEDRCPASEFSSSDG